MLCHRRRFTTIRLDCELFKFTQMDDTYQHPSIQLFIMGLKPQLDTTESTSKGIDQTIDEAETNKEKNETGEGCSEVEQVAEFVGEKVKEDGEVVTEPPNAKLSEWEARRYGSIAARLLQDVKITNT